MTNGEMIQAVSTLLGLITSLVVTSKLVVALKMHKSQN
jgi:hypothetical protein